MKIYFTVNTKEKRKKKNFLKFRLVQIVIKQVTL